MAEYRLVKVATELNRSFQELADILKQLGFDVLPKPTTRISEELYQILKDQIKAGGLAVDELKILKSSWVADQRTINNPVSNSGRTNLLVSPTFVTLQPKLLGKIDIVAKKSKRRQK
jgi:hypothetical protein